MHDLILVICSLLISVAIFGGCSRIADVIGSFTIQIVKDDGEVHTIAENTIDQKG